MQIQETTTASGSWTDLSDYELTMEELETIIAGEAGIDGGLGVDVLTGGDGDDPRARPKVLWTKLQ